MINVSCGPRFQLLTSVISPSPWQHKVNNKNSPDPGTAQQGMSVLKENKCLACPQNQRKDPCEAEQFIDRKTAENGEQGLQQADKKKKKKSQII